MNDSILLFSGGVDSFVAYHFLNKPHTVYFDLKTPYSEREKVVIKKLIPNTIIDNSLSLGDRQVGDKAYIPFRNLYLAMLATKYSDTIIIVGIKGDDVSDKNPYIFNKFSKILSEMEGRTITITSPFWGMTKEDIVEWYLSTCGSEEELLKTISCYSADGNNYCGKCPCCFRKWVAFRTNGIDIEFWNKELIQEYYQAALGEQYVKERNESIIREVDAYRS